jgi:hypothetical protein
MYEVQIGDDELNRLKSLRGPNRTIALVRAWQNSLFLRRMNDDLKKRDEKARARAHTHTYTPPARAAVLRATRPDGIGPGGWLPRMLACSRYARCGRSLR